MSLCVLLNPATGTSTNQMQIPEKKNPNANLLYVDKINEKEKSHQ